MRQHSVLRRVLRRFWTGFWGRVLRRVLRRRSAMHFTAENGSEKGSQKCALNKHISKTSLQKYTQVVAVEEEEENCIFEMPLQSNISKSASSIFKLGKHESERCWKWVVLIRGWFSKTSSRGFLGFMVSSKFWNVSFFGGGLFSISSRGSRGFLCEKLGKFCTASVQTGSEWNSPFFAVNCSCLPLSSRK